MLIWQMTIDTDGQINSQLVTRLNNGIRKIRKGSQSNSKFRYSHWLNPDAPPTELYKVDNNLYQLSLSPITVGSKLIGWVGFGYQIDDRLAMRYQQLSGLETSFILQEHKESQWHLVASSNKKSRTGICLGYH